MMQAMQCPPGEQVNPVGKNLQLDKNQTTRADLGSVPMTTLGAHWKGRKGLVS